MIDHDRLFKELLNTFLFDFIELFLPAVASYIERSSIGFIDKEIFTDVTEGERYEADLVVRAKFRGEDSCFLIHMEMQAKHQTSFSRRLFTYFARLHEKFNLPVYPIALLSFDSPRSKQPCDYRVLFPDLEVLRFNYAVVQLNRLNWRLYAKQKNPVAAALMAKMDIATEDRPHVKLECMRLLAELKLDPAKQHMISGFVDTYLKLTADELEVYRRTCGTLDRKEQEGIMEIETSWKIEGRIEGREEGREEGRVEGREEGRQAMADAVCRLLIRHIGPLEPAELGSVQKLELSQLNSLVDSALDFSSVADLQHWLAALKSRHDA